MSTELVNSLLPVQVGEDRIALGTVEVEHLDAFELRERDLRVRRATVPAVSDDLIDGELAHPILLKDQPPALFSRVPGYTVDVLLFRSATGRPVEELAVLRKELESLGSQILANVKTAAGKGFLSRPAKELYTAAKKAGVRIVGKELNNTRKAMLELRDELLPFAEFQQVKGALGVLKNSAKTLSAESDFNAFITVRQNIGVAIRAAQNVEGIKLGSAKKLFKAMSQDLDDLAARQPTARAGKLAKAAAKRAKIEFSVRDIEGLVARFTEDLGEGELKINAKGILKQMRALVDPKSKKFDKNFADGLGDSLPDIMRNLSSLAKHARAGSPGGPGSIVIRGITAGGGAAIGSVLGGAPGAVIGGLLGAGGPEVMTALLMSKPAMAFLNAAAKAGRGTVSRRAWQVVGQILTRSLGERKETPFSATDVPGGA